MRFNEAVSVNAVPPIHHIGLQDNNQLQRSSSEIIINGRSDDSLTADRANGEFRPGRDSTARDNSPKVSEHNLNNNLDNSYQSSSTESLADYEGYYEEPERDACSDSDWSEYSEDGLSAGYIVNTNYLAFQHLAPSLLSDTDDTDDEPWDEGAPEEPDTDNEERAGLHEDIYNNNGPGEEVDDGIVADEAVNRFDAARDEKQLFYEKPKFNIQSVSSLIECMNYVKSVEDPSEVEIVQLTTSVKETLQFPCLEEIPDSSKSSETEEVEEQRADEPVDLIREALGQGEPMAAPEKPPAKLEEMDLLASIRPEARASVPDLVANKPAADKKDKMALNQARRRQQDVVAVAQRGRQEAKRRTENDAGSFDVYNIETAMPKIDMDAIETHLKAAREEERRRRNDREEIRRRLAMGPDADEIRAERGRKPSLQSRLQSGMNLQICFMNETSSDSESTPGAESPASGASSAAPSPSRKLQAAASRPQVLSLPPLRLEGALADAPRDEADFFARQARLQTEARMALAQAKEMAHMQMEVERQKLKQNPITEMVRASLQKIGVTLGEERRRLTRALLTELNIAQLQVLANDLHARIATLNEALVEGLMRRDDLHMEQDSMLVDVEDLTRYLGAKQESFKKRQLQSTSKRKLHQESQQQQQRGQRQATSRTLAILGRAPSLAAGRQLVVNLVRK